MSRAGMSSIIDEVRLSCNASQNEYTVNGVAFWTDDQIEAAADRFKNNITMLKLNPEYTPLSGYVLYRIPIGAQFRIEEGDAFKLYDASYNVISTGFVVDYKAKTVVFSQDQEGKTFYVDIVTYFLPDVIAYIWKQKAAHYASITDWSSDNHSIKASQLHRQAVANAQHFSENYGIKTSRLVRDDQS